MKEFDRPLGLEPRPARRRSPGLSVRRVLSGAAAVAIFGVSALIAVQGRPFLTPVPEAPAEVSTPVPAPTKAASTAQAAATMPANLGLSAASGGPKIIKVPQSDQAGASVIVVHDPSAIGQDLRVAHVPDHALIEDSPDGPLPVRSANGRRPFDVYARPWSGARGARIAIVIGGLAISQTGTQEAIAKLPPEITLAFSTQGNSIGRWMQTARQKGHELLMQVPFEPFDYPRVDSGRNTLTVDASADDNLKRLRWALSRTTNYTGIMNFMGARFTADSAAMQPVFEELGKRGLAYLDDGSSARSAASDLALKDKVPFVGADTAIDASRDRGAILKKLDELERTARAKGYAVGTGSAFTETVDAVSNWAGEARKRGIEIVPISAVAEDPEK